MGIFALLMTVFLGQYNAQAAIENPENLSIQFTGQQRFPSLVETVNRYLKTPYWTPSVRVNTQGGATLPIPNSTEFVLMESRIFYVQRTPEQLLSKMDISMWGTNTGTLKITNSASLNQRSARFNLTMTKTLAGIFSATLICEATSEFSAPTKINGAEMTRYQVSFQTCYKQGSPSEKLIKNAWFTYDVLKFDGRNDISAIQVRNLTIGKPIAFKFLMKTFAPSLKESTNYVLYMSDHILLQLFNQLQLGVANKDYLWANQP